MGAKTYNEVVSVLRSYGLDTTVYESDKYVFLFSIE